jgi:hypothetical protein
LTPREPLAKLGHNDPEGASNVCPAYLDIRNPLDYARPMSRDTKAKIADAIRAVGGDANKFLGDSKDTRDPIMVMQYADEALMSVPGDYVAPGTSAGGSWSMQYMKCGTQPASADAHELQLRMALEDAAEDERADDVLPAADDSHERVPQPRR